MKIRHPKIDKKDFELDSHEGLLIEGKYLLNENDIVLVGERLKLFKSGRKRQTMEEILKELNNVNKLFTRS